MSSVVTCEVGIALKRAALDRWNEDFREAHAQLYTASTQYCTDAGCVFIWRKFPDWSNEFVLHDALNKTNGSEYKFVVVNTDNPADNYSCGTWDYFKLRIKTSISYEGEEWLRN